MEKNTKLIIILGPRYSGKTTIARRIAKEMQCEHLDLDQLIVNDIGQNIDNITNYGQDWQHFRRVETEILKNLLDKYTNYNQSSKYDKLILSCGGGVAVNNCQNTNTGQTFGQIQKELLEKTDALKILLTINEETLCQRIQKDPNKRPPIIIDKINSHADNLTEFLNNRSIAEKLLFRSRQDLYRQLSNICDTTIDSTCDLDNIIKTLLKIICVEKLKEKPVS
jgi:shikimate kinase